MTNIGTPQIVAGISSDAVLNATGKGWDGWFHILDSAHAAQLPHPEIAKYLNEKQGLSGWWSQMVTVGYEQARGLRVAHQKGANFEISKGSTIAAPIETVYNAWADETLRQRWLPDRPIHIRKATPYKSMRVTWSDRLTSLNVHFYEKGGKSQVVVQHTKLASPADAANMKAFWGQALARLKAALEETERA
jgi:uncharacterized protein YndB with AHSA1/START domain